MTGSVLASITDTAALWPSQVINGWRLLVSSSHRYYAIISIAFWPALPAIVDAPAFLPDKCIMVAVLLLLLVRYGNLSGSSNLVVLDHVRRLAAAGAPGVEEREYCVGISFGPGVGIETVLMRRLGFRGVPAVAVPASIPE